MPNAWRAVRLYHLESRLSGCNLIRAGSHKPEVAGHVNLVDKLLNRSLLTENCQTFSPAMPSRASSTSAPAIEPLAAIAAVALSAAMAAV